MDISIQKAQLKKTTESNLSASLRIMIAALDAAPMQTLEEQEAAKKAIAAMKELQLLVLCRD